MAFGSIVAAATVSLALLYRDPPTDEERSCETGAAETEATQSTPPAGEGAGCMMVGNLLGGWLSDHFSRGWVFALGSIVAIAGIGCLALMSGPGDLPLLLLYAVSGFGFGMAVPRRLAL
jgi:MFS family permease